MTMHRIELMAAAMADLTNDEAAAILRRMVDNVLWVHEQPEGIHELTVVQEFQVAVSKFERPRRVYDDIVAQAWDENHVQAYMMTTPELDGVPGDPRQLIRRHMDAKVRERREEAHLMLTDYPEWLRQHHAKSEVIAESENTK